MKVIRGLINLVRVIQLTLVPFSILLFILVVHYSEDYDKSIYIIPSLIVRA